MGSQATDDGPDLTAVPSLVGTPDWSTLDLTPEQGFMLSRVDGQAPLESLIKSSGMADGKALEILTDLRKLELISWTGGASGEGAVQEDLPPWLAPDYQPDNLEPNIDLPEDFQKKLIFLHSRMDEMTHYEILGLERRVDSKTIKRTYFKVSKDFHPDTYFRKNLGTFKSKIEGLFKRVSLAYEVLSREQKREAYDKTLPYEPTPEEIEADKKKEVRKERDQRLREEKLARMKKRSPLAKRRSQARQHFNAAQEELKKKNPVKACNSARLALALDPDNEEFQKLLDEVAPLAGEVRADTEYKRGRYEESMGKEEEALTAYLAAIELNPRESRALHRAAELMLVMKRDIKTALSFCRQAQQLEPDSAEITRTVADLYIEMDMCKNALREYQRYLKLNPFDENIQSKIKALRKSI